MRVRHKVNVTISDDADGKDKLFALDDAASEVVLDGYTECSSGKTKLAATEAWFVPFVNVGDVQGIFLKSTGDFDVSINGGVALPARRGVSSLGVKAPSVKFFFEGTITSVSIGAVEDLNLSHTVWGDPVV